MRLVVLERIGCNIQRFQHFGDTMIALCSSWPVISPEPSDLPRPFLSVKFINV